MSYAFSARNLSCLTVENLLIHISMFSSVIACKQVSCKCVKQLSVAIPHHFQLQAESLIKPLTTCLAHQHSKVRIEGLQVSVCSVMGFGRTIMTKYPSFLQHYAVSLSDLIS